jgi:histone H3/H4
MSDIFETDERHPSFGMVGISHWQSSGTTLVGSEFKHHHGASLTIRRAKKRRSLSQEWWFAQEEIVSIALSEAQLVELIGRPNMGDGVVCTLQHVMGEQMPEPPIHKPMREKFREDFKRDAAECVADLRAAMADLDQAINTGKIGKIVLREIYDKLRSAAASIDDGIPFVEEQFEEAMEKTVNHAATEIEATVTQMAIRLGVERMQEISASAPKLIEGAKETA